MCEELKKRGINIELTSYCHSDKMLELEQRYQQGRRVETPVLPAPLKDVDFDAYFNNIKVTKFEGFMRISVPFSKFLKDERIDVEDYKRRRGL